MEEYTASIFSPEDGGSIVLQDVELATHILCDCKVIAYSRFCQVGQFFV
jgi:hypothetical protein